VRINLTPPVDKRELLTGVYVDVRPSDCPPQQAVTALAQLGPEILRSLRTFLAAEPERQAQERVPFAHALSGFPVLDEGPGRDALVCRGKDLSLGGIGFFAPEGPQTEHLYVQPLLSPELPGLALLGQVVRVQRRDDDVYEVGLAFAKGPETLVRLPGDSHLVR
jgi:hypothetical protein